MRTNFFSKRDRSGLTIVFFATISWMSRNGGALCDIRKTAVKETRFNLESLRMESQTNSSNPLPKNAFIPLTFQVDFWFFEWRNIIGIMNSSQRRFVTIRHRLREGRPWEQELHYKTSPVLWTWCHFWISNLNSKFAISFLCRLDWVSSRRSFVHAVNPNIDHNSYILTFVFYISINYAHCIIS